VKDWTVVVHIDAMISRRVTKIDDLVILGKCVVIEGDWYAL
jgi:hypothetical protein